MNKVETFVENMVWVSHHWIYKQYFVREEKKINGFQNWIYTLVLINLPLTETARTNIFVVIITRYDPNLEKTGTSASS